MPLNYFHQYLVTHKPAIKQRCLEMIGSRSRYSSQSLSVGQLIDGVAAAASGQIEEAKIAALFMELGTRLAIEGWPIKFALEIIHTYPAVVLDELGPNSPKEGSPTETENNPFARKSFEVKEFWQLYEQVDGWVGWLADAYVAQKEGYITELYKQIAEVVPAQELQLEAAWTTAKAICHHISQPLTVIGGIAAFAEDGWLQPDEMQWLRDAVKQAGLVLTKLRNLKRYTVTAQAQDDFILDLDASSADNPSRIHLLEGDTKPNLLFDQEQTTPENEFLYQSWQTDYNDLTS
ncbi:MAG: hypothetical protein WCS37_14765 [Chloroflexota bacterium]